MNDMVELTIGNPAPDFILPTDEGKDFHLNENKGNSIILYFYPKDNTAGCTTEARAFQTHLDRFKKAGYIVVGVSRDSLRKHQSFKAKQELTFSLLSDETGSVCKKYDVIKEKSMYGRKYMGVERSTFVIDSEGIIHSIYRKVKPLTHVNDLLKDLGI